MNDNNEWETRSQPCGIVSHTEIAPMTPDMYRSLLAAARGGMCILVPITKPADSETWDAIRRSWGCMDVNE